MTNPIQNVVELPARAELSTAVQKPESRGRRAWTIEDFLARDIAPKDPLVTGLLHRRDMVALGARRRHGKTSLVTHLAVDLAVGEKTFLGYSIASPARSLLLMLEDDPRELQDKFRRVIDGRETSGRIRLVTREDLYDANIPINVTDSSFQAVVKEWAGVHSPDVIVIDNLSQVLNADYNDAQKTHELIRLCYSLARRHNCAVIIPAHPRKEDPKNPLDLLDQPGQFFESIMGTSHFVNSTGSLWGLQRRPDDTTVFVGGRQRGDGQQGSCLLEMSDDGRFRVVASARGNLALVCNTPKRGQAWNLLPDPPATFGYREAEELVRPALSSAASFSAWMRECRRLGVVVEAPGGQLMKAVELTGERWG
jgi:hypothetical protein